MVARNAIARKEEVFMACAVGGDSLTSRGSNAANIRQMQYAKGNAAVTSEMAGGKGGPQRVATKDVMRSLGLVTLVERGSQGQQQP